MFKTGLVLTLLLLTYIPSAAQGDRYQETVDSLITIAETDYYGLKAADYRTESADYSARAAGTLPDPMIKLGLLNLPSSSLSLDETPMSGIVVGLSQKIPWPGRLGDQNSIAESVRELSRLSRREMAQAVARRVELGYLDYSFYTGSAEIVTDHRELIASLADIAEVDYSHGESSAQDYLRAQTTLSRLDNRLLMIEKSRQTALLQLRELLSDSTDAIRYIPAYLPDHTNADRVDSNGAGNNPTLLKAATSATLAERKIDLARSDYYPDFTIGVDYRFRKNMPGDPVAGDDFITAMVGFNIPLWFFSKQNNRTRSAELSYRAAEMEQKKISFEIERRIADHRQTLDNLIESIETYDKSIIPKAVAAAEAAQVAYEVDKVDFNGLLAARLDLLNIELERLEILREITRRKAFLKELTGSYQNYSEVSS